MVFTPYDILITLSSILVITVPIIIYLIVRQSKIRNEETFEDRDN